MSYEDVLRENERLKSIVEAIATSEKAKAALSKVPFKADLQPTYQVPSKVDKSLLAWAPDKPKNRQDLDSVKRNLLVPSPSDRGPGGPGRGPPSAEGSCDPPLPLVRGCPRVCIYRRVCVYIHTLYKCTHTYHIPVNTHLRIYTHTIHTHTHTRIYIHRETVQRHQTWPATEKPGEGAGRQIGNWWAGPR